MDTEWHFFVMILASFLLFFAVFRLVLSKEEFTSKKTQLVTLSFLVVVAGMLFGKYSATFGLPWWIYYPVPMLVTVLLPPLILKMNKRKTLYYLLLSFLSAPFIHAFFSFFFEWTEYMPFWKIPSLKSLLD